MRWQHRAIGVATLCAGCGLSHDSPYPYCRGTYEPLDADAETALGYTAQEAIDAHGLDHNGALTWALIVDPGYDLPLPPESTVRVVLEVVEIRWGTYAVDTGNLLIAVECPDEGLEIDVEGTAELPGLDLDIPVEGQMTAAIREGSASPEVADLGFWASHTLTDTEVEPFLPTLDAFAEGEGFTYEELEAMLNLRLAATVPEATLQVTWDEGDAISDRGMPFEALLVLDSP